MSKHSSTIRAVAYYRMSTDKQEDSIERQKSQVEPYAARNGYYIIREYTDEGIAGDEEEKRVAFMQMLKDAKRGQFELILCDDKDRFGRFDSITAGYYVKPLRDAGVKLETVAQGRQDWTSFAGRIIDTVLQESKKLESQATSRRVLTMMLNLAQKGKWLGGPAPYGYRLAPDPLLGKRLVPGPAEEVATVRLVFDLYGNEGYTFDAIVEELARRRISRADSRKQRAYWDKATLWRMLRNRKYVGDMVWNIEHDGKYSEYRGGQVHTSDRRTPGHRNPRADWIVSAGTHEALVDRALFEKVSTRLQENQTRTAPRKGKTAPKGGAYALGGLLVCNSCGWRMIGTISHGLRAYKCGRYLLSGRAGCFCNHIMEHRLVNGILAKLEAVADSPFLVEQFAERVRQEEAAIVRAAPRQTADLQKRLKALEAKVDQAMERMAFIDKELLTEYGAKVRGWKEERDQLRGQIAEASAPIVPFDVEATVNAAKGLLRQIRKALASASPSEVRNLLGQLISKVELFFEQQPMKGGKVRSYFRKGVVSIRRQSSTEETSELLRALCRL